MFRGTQEDRIACFYVTASPRTLARLIALVALAALGIVPAARAQELFVGSFNNNRVLRYNGVTGASIDAFVPAGSGGLQSPDGLAFGPDGNLYVSSFFGDQILRYSGATGAFLDVFVSTGSGGLSSPDALLFGPDGNLYVSSSFNTDAVLRYNGATGAFIDAFVTAGSGGLDSPIYPIFRPAPAAGVIPEPGTLALLAVGGIGATALRKRRRA